MCCESFHKTRVLRLRDNLDSSFLVKMVAVMSVRLFLRLLRAHGHVRVHRLRAHRLRAHMSEFCGRSGHQLLLKVVGHGAVGAGLHVAGPNGQQHRTKQQRSHLPIRLVFSFA